MLFASVAWAQLYTGLLTGVVTDPSGGVVPNAAVTATDVGKGFKYKTSTDSVGRYLLRPLPPATYQLTVEARGFRTALRSGIVLNVNENATVDVSLQVVGTTQKVEVIAAAPLLQAQDATTGQEVDRRFINDLPLVNRQVLDLAFLAPGVNPAPLSPYSGGVANNFTSNGGRNMTADVLIDGISNTATDPNGTIQDVSYIPSVDAVQEFKIMQNNFSAEFGQSGNTVLNIVMRSGTNQFHGSAYDFLRNSAMDSNNWFNNLYGTPLAALHWNNFGSTFGGPIQKDKLFFFVDYEGSRTTTQAGPFQMGVPSVPERNGDFGELCADNGGSFDSTGLCSVPQGQLWDAYSGYYDPNLGGPVRTAFIPYNNISAYTSPGSPVLAGTPYQVRSGPGNLIDPVASRMMAYFPLPNLNVGNPALYNRFLNWTGSGVNTSRNDQGDVRIDRRVGDRTSLSGRFTYGEYVSLPALCFKNSGVLDPCSGGQSSGGPRAFVLNSSHTFGPSMVLAVSFGFTRSLSESQGDEGTSFDLVKELGFPSYMTTSGYHGPPQISIANYGSSLGGNPWNLIVSAQDTWHMGGSIDKVLGRHELKFGGDFRVRRLDYLQPGPVNGQFSFDIGMTSQSPNSGTGDGMASFLTGLMDGYFAGQYHYGHSQSTQNLLYSGFLQDNWRITDKLTLNLGMRYEVQVPRTERHNYLSWFDPNVISPIQAPCVDVSVPDLPGQICPGTLHGGLQFAHSGDREMAYTNYNNWGPRVGLAYQFLAHTVMRAGYGIFYEPTYFAGNYGAYGTDGFDAWTYAVNTYQSDGATPFAPLSDPFPNGLNAPPGSSLGLLTEVGQTVFAPIRSWNAMPYMQTWSLGFQHELPGNTVVDVNYVGTNGTHLYYAGTWLSHLGPWIEKADPTMVAAMNTFIPNPFYGVITNPASPLSAPTIWAGTFYSVPSGYFPQFASVNPTSPPAADSVYDAFQLKVEKRMSNGLQFLGTYVFSKAIDDSSIGNGNTSWAGGAPYTLVDPNNLKNERSVSQFDIPQVLTLAYTYQLPVGRGRHWGHGWNKWLDGFLGGWQTNGFWRIDNGQPIGPLWENYSNQPLPSYGQRPDLLAPLQRASRSSAWFNVDPNGYGGYFSNPQDAAIAQPYTIGTAPRMLSSVRAPGNNNASLSLFKEISLSKMHEGARLEYRLESFNALNHTVFCAPNLGVASGQFGLVTGQCNSPREVQMGLKFYW